MNIQTKLRLDRLTVYLERVKADLDHDNLPAAMADLAELGEQSRRMYNFLMDVNIRYPRIQKVAPPPKAKP
jgi:hypothetical protein